MFKENNTFLFMYKVSLVAWQDGKAKAPLEIKQEKNHHMMQET